MPRWCRYVVWLHLFASVFYDDLVAEPPRFNRVAAAVCQRVNAMIGSGVGVVPVFDGGGTAAKAGTSAKRAATAEKRKAKILQVLESCRLGNVEGVDEEHLKRQLGQAQAKITPDLVDAVIILLRKSGFSYLVAPHEADHQLVHMLQIGIIDYIVTVDSDLLCHTGVKTIVTAIGGFMGGEARLFNPGCLVKEPGDSDLGSVIQNAVRHVRGKTIKVGEGDAEVGAAVCLAYSFLVGNDYSDQVAKGFGPVKAITALQHLINEEGDNLRGKPDAVLDPDLLLDSVRATTKLEISEEAVKSNMVEATTAFRKGLAYWLAEDENHRTKKPLDGTSTEDQDLSALGEVESDPDKAVLLALGLRCRRSACQVCMDPEKRHLLEDGIDNEDDPLDRFVPHNHLDGAVLSV